MADPAHARGKRKIDDSSQENSSSKRLKPANPKESAELSPSERLAAARSSLIHRAPTRTLAAPAPDGRYIQQKPLPQRRVTIAEANRAKPSPLWKYILRPRSQKNEPFAPSSLRTVTSTADVSDQEATAVAAAVATEKLIKEWELAHRGRALEWARTRPSELKTLLQLEYQLGGQAAVAPTPAQGLNVTSLGVLTSNGQHIMEQNTTSQVMLSQDAPSQSMSDDERMFREYLNQDMFDDDTLDQNVETVSEKWSPGLEPGPGGSYHPLRKI